MGSILNADIGTGSTITLGTSTWESSVEILSMDWSGVSREAIPTSHLASTKSTQGSPPTTPYNFGSSTFIPAALEDGGEITLEVHLNPDTPLPIRESSETVTITFNRTESGSTGAKWAGIGFCVDSSASVPLEGVMTGSVTYKFSGLITQTDSVDPV